MDKGDRFLLWIDAKVSSTQTSRFVQQLAPLVALSSTSFGLVSAWFCVSMSPVFPNYRDLAAVVADTMVLASALLAAVITTAFVWPARRA